MCAVNVPAAHAGYWEFVPLPTDYSARQAEASERYPGNIEVKIASTWTGYGYKPYPEKPELSTSSYPLAEMIYDTQGGGSGSFGGSSYSTGGEGSVVYSGTIQVKLRYVQDTIVDDNGDEVPDPEDVPRTPFSIKVTASSSLSAQDGTGNGDVRMTSKESVSAAITPAGNGTTQPDASDVQSSSLGKYLDSYRTIYVLVDPQGELTKTVPIIKFDTKASLGDQRVTQTGDSSDENSHWNNGSAQNWSRFSSTVTDYGLFISSNLEPSWKKFDGDLPQEYKKRVNVAGVWEWQPDPDKAQPVSGDPQIWRVKCRRGADGSLEVESAATWVYAAWKGKVSLSANPIGFFSPQYYWSLSGGGSVAYSPDWTLNTWDLSSEANSVILPDSESLPTSTFEVKVTNPNPALSLTANYNVHWHYPYEPYHKRPSVYNSVWRKALSNVDDGPYFGDTDGNISSETNPYHTTEDTFIPLAKASLGAVEDISSVVPVGKDIADILTKVGGKSVDWYEGKYYPSVSRHFTSVSEAWAYSQQHQQSGNSEVEDPQPIGGLVPTGLIADPDGWTKCNHQVVEIVHWRRENWDAEVYRHDGYTSHDGLVNANEPMGVTVEVAFKQVRFP